MQRGYVIRGTLRGRRIDLDESLDGLDGEVELFVKPLQRSSIEARDVVDVIERLPPGTLTNDEVDARIREARSGWDERD